MATTLYWDPTASLGAHLGGAGTWDTTSAAWYNPLTNTDVAWNNANGDKAVFSGSADTVMVSSGIAASEIDFTTTAYTLQGGSLAIGGAGTIDVASGVNATISSGLNGTNGLTKTSDGALLLSGTSAYTGATSVVGGRLTLADVNLSSSSADISAGATLEYNDTSGTLLQGSLTLTGSGTLEKSGSGTLIFGNYGPVNWNLGSGALIDVESGTLVGGNSIQDDWTNNLASLNIAGGATFDGVEANVRIDALTGAGTFAGGWSGAGYANDTIGVNGGSGTFSGTIQDSSAPLNLVKAGAGTETLSGTASYSGSTTISAGELGLQDLKLASGSVAIAAGATLEYEIASGTLTQGSLTLSGSGTLEKSGSGTLIFGNYGPVNWNLGSGSLIDVEGGTLVGGNSIQDNWTNDLASLNIAGGATFDGVEANIRIDALTGSGTFAGGWSGAGYASDTIGVNGGSGSFSGTIQDSSAPLNLVKEGAGTETLSGAIPYTGSTSIANGQLTLQDLKLNSNSVDIAFDGVLDYDTSGSLTQGSLTLSGTGVLEKTGDGTLIFGNYGPVHWDFGSGALIDVEGGTLVGGNSIQDDWSSDVASLNIASGATFDGVEANVRVDALTGFGTFAGGWVGAGYSADTIGVDGGSGTFSGVIRDSSAPLNLTKEGAGTETLAGANTYTGVTTINAGTLQLGNDGFDDDELSDADLRNGVVLGDIVNNSTLEFDNPNSQTYSGSISGTGNVTVNGPGTLIFNGANAYTGTTTVNQGTFEVDTFIMPSAVTLNTCGTLQGSGGTGAVTNNGGTYVAGYYYVQLTDTTLQRGDTSATSTGSASISESPSDAIYAMSAAQAVFQVVSGSATNTVTGDTHAISTAAIAGANGHPAFIYSDNGYHDDNNGTFHDIGQAIMYEDYTAHAGCDYDYNDGYFRVVVTNASAPIARDDSYSFTPLPGTAPGVLTVTAANGVLLNDSGDRLVVRGVPAANNGGPKHGAVAMMADGSFTYNPNDNAADIAWWAAQATLPNASDTFQYYIQDSRGQTAYAFVTITYGTWVKGTPGPSTRAPTPELMLQGGGDWPFNGGLQTLAQDAGGGSLVILYSSPQSDDPYELAEQIWQKYGDTPGGAQLLKSVSLYIVTSTAQANAVAPIVAAASAVFIGGGDQTKDAALWSGNLQAALQSDVNNGDPIGGTSAGMAILGDLVYEPAVRSVTSAEAMANPASPGINLAPKFLNIPVLDNNQIITDTHFGDTVSYPKNRQRLGRLITFLADAESGIGTVGGQTLNAPHAVASDTDVAVMVDPATGVATVVGPGNPNHAIGYAYFVNTPPNVTINPDGTLSTGLVTVYRIQAGSNGTFNLNTWQGTGGVALTFEVVDGKLKQQINGQLVPEPATGP